MLWWQYIENFFACVKSFVEFCTLMLIYVVNLVIANSHKIIINTYFLIKADYSLPSKLYYAHNSSVHRAYTWPPYNDLTFLNASFYLIISFLN